MPRPRESAAVLENPEKSGSAVCAVELGATEKVAGMEAEESSLDWCLSPAALSERSEVAVRKEVSICGACRKRRCEEEGPVPAVSMRLGEANEAASPGASTAPVSPVLRPPPTLEIPLAPPRYREGVFSREATRTAAALA
jgi:hypothetical protein